MMKISERGFPNLSQTMTLNAMYYANLIISKSNKVAGCHYINLEQETDLLAFPFIILL